MENPWRFRFRLSTILLVMLLAAVFCAWASDRRKLARLEEKHKELIERTYDQAEKYVETMERQTQRMATKSQE
jgi:hypothetical protein